MLSIWKGEEREVISDGTNEVVQESLAKELAVPLELVVQQRLELQGLYERMRSG